jgi:hypothetical protein
MAKRGRPRKDKPRTKSGRLSRAYKSAQLRDEGTAEFRAKRRRLIDGADPQLAATASGILLANGALTQEQHNACLHYAWAHAVTFGRPWRQSCPLGERVGTETPDRVILIARAVLAKMDAVLTYEQRLAVANLAVFGLWPGWFTAAKLGLRPMPEDEPQRRALLAGLDALREA